MKRLVLFSLVSLAMAFGFTACKEESPSESPPTPVTAKAVYVLNSAATSISVIDLENDQVFNNVATVGTWPNQILYYDGKVYVVNSGSNNIMIFDPDNNWADETPIDLGAGNNPMNMVFYDNTTAFVACSMSNKVLKVDMSSKTVTAEIDAGVGTTGICLADGKVYATNTAFDGATYTYGQGTVTVIDPDDATVITTIDVATNPQSCAVAPDGKVHVVSTGNYVDAFGVITVIDPSTNTVTDTLAIGGSPGGIAISTPDNLAYLSVWGMGCLVYNTSTLAIVHGPDDMFHGSGGSGVLVSPQGYVFLSMWDDDQVLELDKDETVINTYNVGDSPMSLTMKTTQ